MEKRLYELTNGEITIAVSNCGAELHSVQKDGAEYLWQAGVPGRDEISKKSVRFCDIFQFLQNYKKAVAKPPLRCCI